MFLCGLLERVGETDFSSEILRLPGHCVEQLLGMNKPGIVCCQLCHFQILILQ